MGKKGTLLFNFNYERKVLFYFNFYLKLIARYYQK